MKPEVKRRSPRISVSIKAGRVARRGRGMEFRAMTGRLQRVTQVAWAKKAPKNLGGDFLISSTVGS